VQHGPVDVVAVAIGQPQFDGSVLAELEKVATTGMIRVLDAMVLVKADDGSVLGMDLEDLPEEEKAKLGFIETNTRGLFDVEDSMMLAEGLVPGSAIIALAIEHVWAVGLVNALYDQGAEIALSYRVPAATVDERFAALAAE
jgi:Family of unknown function (DUF6325)